MNRLAVVAVACLSLGAGALRADSEGDKRIKDLKHRDPVRRIEAAEFLGSTKYYDAAPALAEALGKDREPDVRAAAARALWDLGVAANDYLPQLRVALGDSSGLVRLYAAGALRSLDEPDEDVLPAVRSVLRSAEPWNRAYAVVMLLEMRVPILELVPAIESVLLDPVGTRADRYELDIFSGSVDAVADDPNVEAKQLLLEGLQDQRSLPAELVPALEFAGKNLDSTVRMRAMTCLGKVKQDPAAQLARLRTAAKSKNSTDRWTALHMMAQLEPLPPEVIDDLVAATSDRDETVRALAAENLGKAKPPTPAVMQALMRTLADRNEDVRKAACEGLEDLGPAAQEAVPTLRKMAASDKDQWVRSAAESALARIAPK